MMLRKKFRISSSDVNFKKEGSIHRSAFYKLSRPIIWMQWVTGRTPCSIKCGWLRYRLLSFSFAYAVCFHMGIFFVHWWHREHFNNHWQNVCEGITFQNVLFSILMISQVLHSVLAAYSWMWEVPYIVSNYNTTIVLEAKARELLPLCGMSKWLICLKTSVIVSFFVGVLVFTWMILPHQLEDVSRPLICSYVVIIMVQNSYSAMWLFNFYFIRLVAQDLLKLTIEVLQNSRFPGKQLSEFRHLWLSVWDLSQKYAYSIAISMSFGLVLHCCTFITSCYGILSLIRLQAPLEKILPLLPYFFASFLSVFLVVEITHRAKTALKDEFLNAMIHVDRDTIDHEGYDEVKLFTKTILEADPKITLYDFFTVDRHLLISFLSTSITYLIVLLQFRANEEQSESNFSMTSTPEFEIVKNIT